MARFSGSSYTIVFTECAVLVQCFKMFIYDNLLYICRQWLNLPSSTSPNTSYPLRRIYPRMMDKNTSKYTHMYIVLALYQRSIWNRYRNKKLSFLFLIELIFFSSSGYKYVDRDAIV